MSFFEKDRVPFLTAIWMIVLPLVFAFFAGAGAGTIFNGLASFLGALVRIFGGASLLFGILLLGWVVWRAYQAGDLPIKPRG